MGSKRLSDVVAEIVDAVLRDEVINKRQAAVERWDAIDPDGQYIAGIEGLVARIEAKARQVHLTSRQRTTEAQPTLPFALPAAVSMDLEGHTIRATRSLTRDEFMRAIEIREQQIANDSQALREWRTAMRLADRIWARHLDWSFGRCLDAILDARTPTAA